MTNSVYSVDVQTGVKMGMRGEQRGKEGGETGLQLLLNAGEIDISRLLLTETQSSNEICKHHVLPFKSPCLF